MTKLYKQYFRDRHNNCQRPRGVIIIENCDQDLLVGFSLCCKKDTFNKQTGTEIAYNRLDSGRYAIYMNNKNDIQSVKQRMPHSLHSLFDHMIEKINRKSLV